MNPTLKRYLISSAVTFLTGFLLAVGMTLQTLEPLDLLQAGTLIGLLVTGLRAGIKALVEYLPRLIRSNPEVK